MNVKKVFPKLAEYQRTVDLCCGPASQAGFGEKRAAMRERGAQQGAPGDGTNGAPEV